ncbi:gamma-glutamyltransferase [Cytobacillus sp. FJAT-54145]|uniref:Glutathione hydrolase proenzyme n=1 Tax=Cytobacillus spartinae TaxID=3299023 RepID=A0ABW6K609_9BACI
MPRKRLSMLLFISIFLIAIVLFNYGKDDRLLPKLDERINNLDLLKRKPELGKYSVVADNPTAVEIGMAVLNNGGNAVDAAVAVSFALSVLEPYASGIGGGGLMLVHPTNQREPILYDYRETAPLHRTSKNIGVPGFVKGIEMAHNDFGVVPFEDLIEPSIHLAEKGIEVSSILHTTLKNAAYRMPVQQLEHFYPNSKPIKTGELLVQSELATTLKQIKEQHSSVFYTGNLSEDIVNSSKITRKDLRGYKVRVSAPVKGDFSGYTVYAPPPPAGGVMLIQTLQMAEILNISQTRGNLPDYATLLGEIIKRSYKNRLNSIGDPEFNSIPIKKLTSKDFSSKLAHEVEYTNKNSTTPLDSKADMEEQGNTTHFVIVDSEGMMVSTTNTLSNFFGSGHYVNGFFLNNQLDNFSLRKDSPNSYEAGKRPHSYISPLILAKDDKPIIGIGSSGGRRIPSTIANILIRICIFNEDPQDAVSSARFFSEFNKNMISLENKQDTNVENELQEQGYILDYSHSPSYFGASHVLIINYDKKEIIGAADSRRGGKWAIR